MFFDGTAITISLYFFILDGLLPVSDIIFAPRILAFEIPFRIFFELPLVEIPITTSPFFTNFSTLLYAEVAKKDCSLIKNLYKKMICKTNNATATINAKKKLTDYLPNDLLKKKE